MANKRFVEIGHMYKFDYYDSSPGSNDVRNDLGAQFNVKPRDLPGLPFSSGRIKLYVEVSELDAARQPNERRT